MDKRNPQYVADVTLMPANVMQPFVAILWAATAMQLSVAAAVPAVRPSIIPDPELQGQIDRVARTSLRDEPVEKYRQALALRFDGR